jgi:S-adenosylmethionine decarboxylase
MNGIEWIVEAHGCSPASLADLRLLRALFQRIIADLKLRPVGETQWHQFPETGGVSGLCLLAESHLTCHTFPEFGSICLNLFCCVPRTEWDFARILKEMLAADSVRVRSMVRPYIPSTVISDEHSASVAVNPTAGRRAE